MASLRSAADGPAEAVPSEDASSARLDRMLRSAAGARAPTTLSRLPFSREEAQAILSLAPRDASLEATGFRATRELATGGELPAYRIVHFATHGLLNAESPDLSGLVLSLVDEVGRRRDGVVRLRDVQRMKLSADLVVLSGCQTALGKEISGEGLVGLTRGFLHAGARNVVASLWRVDDLATAELMKRFYGPMLRDGKPAAAALRQAQIEMSRTKRWSAPFYWAGFVIQGDWTAATPRLPAAVP
jgi:CHAT domain-containing protein